MADNDYSPMTANEAGQATAGRTCAVAEHPFGCDCTFAGLRETPPSKPCTECLHDLNDHFVAGGCEHEVEGEHCTCKRYTAPNCLEGGDHCFCVVTHVAVLGQGNMMGNTCCHCNVQEIVRYTAQRVPGHGPFRTELVRE